MAGPYEARLMRVLEHIHDNPAGDLSLDTLADIAAMSRFHWHRVFVAMTGETCAEAVRRVRLHRAACLLVQSDRPVAEIAAATGHSGPQAFSRAFKAAYGLPPASFRARGALVPPRHTIRKGDTAMFPVDIDTLPARRLAAIAHKGAYLEVGGAFERLSGLVASRGLWGHVRGMIGIYHDDPDAVPEP